MCNYFSCLITRDLKVVWDTSMVSHEELIKKAGLEDDKLIDRDFVRIEILPIGETYSKLTRNKKDWVFKIDEEATLPEWFKSNEAECEALCWTAWSESVKVNIALNDEVIVIKGNDFVYAYGNSSVNACDNSSVIAYGNSSVIAYGFSSIHKYSSDVKINLKDNAHIFNHLEEKIETFINKQ
jgi:hypothetical protein